MRDSTKITIGITLVGCLLNQSLAQDGQPQSPPADEDLQFVLPGEPQQIVRPTAVRPSVPAIPAVRRQHPTPVNVNATYGAVRPAYPQYGPYGASPVAYQRQAPQPSMGPQGYPQTNAALYPSPVPTVPIQVGATAITNQALHPHEFLYPHDYRAIYPPFYYKVRGSWFVTPFGVWSKDRWELQGTEVKVKYRSKQPVFANFLERITN